MKQSAEKRWRCLTTVTASLMAVAVGGGSIANARADFINSRLGTTGYRMEQSESSGDGIYYDSEFDSLEELVQAKEELAAEISSEGSVLFKNENQALPLNKESEKVTLWGLNSHLPGLAGLIGSSVVADAEHGQTAYGIEEAMEERGFQVNESMKAFYASDVCAPYYRKASFFGNEVPGHSLSPAFAASYKEADSYLVGEAPGSLYTDDVLASAKDTTAVVVLSRDSSEAADYSINMKDPNGDSFERPLAISAYEREMIALAKENSNGKVIVLINSDMPMEIEELKQDQDIDSILWTGLPGMNGFLGVCDVLSGDVNPSGHISDTYASNVTSSPSMNNFGLYLYSNNSTAGADAELTETNKADWYVVETEGIYVGYKYYETRYEDTVLGQGYADSPEGTSTGNAWSYEDEVTYPFGYGLSYTKFEQKLESVDVSIGGEGMAKVTVTNVGDVAGKDVAQLYVQTPYTENGVEKAAVRLLDFGKTKVLEPGESETLEITFDPQYLASYDEDAVKANGTQGAWVLDEGEYYFTVGNGAHEALNNILADKTGTTDNLTRITTDETIKKENVVKISLQEDQETYSVNVENTLQDADINKQIPDAAEYTTRTDWSKGWKSVEGLTPTEEMMKGLTNSTYELTENGSAGDVTWGADNGLRAVDFIITDDDGNYQGVLPLSDPKWDELLDQLTMEEAANFLEKAGDKNFEKLDSIGLTEAIWYDGPIGFSYDQIAGYKTRWTDANKDEPTYVPEDNPYAQYSMSSMPTEPVVAAAFNKELAEREGELFGEDGLWANVNSIAGPGLNLHRSPYCSRNHEYYSEDAMLTNLLGQAVCRGGQSKGIMMMPKHYAFNHQELNRSGTSTFFTEQAARENELRCFQGVMSNNYAQGVMTGFNRVGSVFSGAHAGLQMQIARKEWGYEGYTVTDMVNGADYMNWRDNVFGGGGGCLTTSAYETSEIGSMTSKENLELIAGDAAFQQRMKDNIKYFVYNTVKSNTMNSITSSTRYVKVMTWWQGTLLGVQIAFGVLTFVFAFLFFKASVQKGKKKEEIVNEISGE